MINNFVERTDKTMATFRKTSSGKWQARVLKDGKQVSIGTFSTKKEAQIEASKVEERIYYGQALNDRNMLFSELVDVWMNTYKRNNLKESTFKQLTVAVRLHILPYFGHKKIVKVSRADITLWLQKYYEFTNEDGTPKYSYGSRIKYLSYMKSILHYAVFELGILEKNPSDKLKAPIKDKITTQKATKYYSLEELNKLLDFMENYKHQRFEDYRIYYTLMYFLSQTGLRISEALALKWSDIDGDKVKIDKQTSRDDNNNLKITTLKNSSSYRTIKLDDDVVRELKKFKIKQNEMILSYQEFRKNDEGIIFQNFLGNYLTPSTVRETIKEYCMKAEVDYKGTHCFRHTHAVLLLEAGASLKFVSNRLGHKTIKTTADEYLDITNKIEEDELEKFASYTKRNI